MSESLSERLRPYKERIAAANSSIEARKQTKAAATNAAPKLVMRAQQQDNEIYIVLTHSEGNKDLEVQAAEKVMDLLEMVCEKLGIKISSSTDE